MQKIATGYAKRGTDKLPGLAGSWELTSLVVN